MANLFDDLTGMENILDALEQMNVNCPDPASNSRELWNLRHQTNINPCNLSSEKMLEKAVSMLAKNGHMSGWYNQCPTASGIGDSGRYKHCNVDLVRWDEVNASAHLIELKWKSDTPSEAIGQVLRYGAVYLYCRKHREKLPVSNRPIMDANHISLCILAPHSYYAHDQFLEEKFYNAKQDIERLNIKPVSPGLSMSLEVLAFPESFSVLPFRNGGEVRKICDQKKLNSAGKIVRDAFDGLLCLHK
ncbi:MAG: hypothetical protein OXE80_02460 [Gammaproteobacteria bacterium]|nr:hypothetical protein [Gammaproteobacteria bacterium]